MGFQNSGSGQDECSCDDLLILDKDISKWQQKYSETIKKFLKEPHELLPQAYDNWKAVKDICGIYAKRNAISVKTEISIEHHTAIVSLKTGMLSFTEEDDKLLQELKKRTEKIVIVPFKYVMQIDFYVLYFADADSPAKKANAMLLKEIFNLLP